MSPLPAWRRYLRFFGADADADVDDELRFHLDMRAAELEAHGYGADEARAAAVSRFGDIQHARDACRTIVHRREHHMARVHLLDDLRLDLRFGVRSLVRRPGFTIIAALTLGLGIGANAAIFSAVNALLFRPLPVRDAGRLVALGALFQGTDIAGQISYPNYLDIREGATVFEDALAYSGGTVSLRTGADAERRFVELVSDNFFTMLGLEAVLGRTITADEGRSGQQVIVLSHAFWQTHFGSARDVIGRVVHINGLPFTVVGVSPKWFAGLAPLLAVDGWVPARTQDKLFVTGRPILEARDAGSFRVLARLVPGIGIDEARVRTAVVARRLEAAYPVVNRGFRLVVFPEVQSRPDIAVASVMPRIALVFMGLVFAVLLIACANVGNLLLARATSRTHELALRSAIGASRGRLVRQLLSESLLIAGLGLVVGMAITLAVVHWLEHLHFAIDAPARFDLHADWRVFLFAVIAALVAAVTCGLVPALRSSRPRALGVLRDGVRGSASVGSSRMRSGLVVAQVAVSLTLLVCAGLFAAMARRATQIDLGFRPDHQLMLSVDVSLQRYSRDRARRFYDALLERASALPGVETAALARRVPLGYENSSMDIFPGGDAQPVPDGRLDVFSNTVSQGYLAAMGIPLVSGRGFTPRDDSTHQRVGVINQALAHRLWPGQDAVGKRVRFDNNEQELEIVGVVKTGKYLFISDGDRPFLYLPLAQRYADPVTLHLRTTGDPLTLAPAARALVTALDRELAIYDVRTMDEHLAGGLAFLFVRLAATLAGAVGLLGLLQTVVGLYGVISYAVSQRTHEIGIRLALGARPRDVLRIVVGQGLRLTVAGLTLGAGLAYLAARAVASLLTDVGGARPLTIAVAVLVLTVSATLASAIPAWRAARVDPVRALRDA